MNKVSKAIIGSLLLLAPFFVSAHPGNTAADGCHYCRTNCDKWGVAWNERHCHNAKPISVPVSAPPPPKPKATPVVAPQTTISPKSVAAPATTTKPAVTTTIDTTSAPTTSTTVVPEVFVPPQTVAPEPKRPGFFTGMFKALFGWFGN